MEAVGICYVETGLFVRGRDTVEIGKYRPPELGLAPRFWCIRGSSGSGSVAPGALERLSDSNETIDLEPPAEAAGSARSGAGDAKYWSLSTYSSTGTLAS